MELQVSDIKSFFQTCKKAENDKTNKIRERVLNTLSNPSKEFLEDPKYGSLWTYVHKEFMNSLKTISEKTNIPSYTSVKVNSKGGRNFNYDIEAQYYNENELVATKKIEFKKGGKKIDNLPQFLSLQAKYNLFDYTYDKFYYENYLEQYLALDNGITEVKPSLETYLKQVTSTSYSICPFFQQLKDRENVCKKEKESIVNKSIEKYLDAYGNKINSLTFEEKVKDSQLNKIYMLWSNGKFSIDYLDESKMNSLTFNGISKKNTLLLKGETIVYKLLLRWRNHKGILNPAWQISLKREKE